MLLGEVFARTRTEWIWPAEDMHKMKADLVVVSSVVRILLVTVVVIQASVSESNARCFSCHPADPDAKRNVVSLQNVV